MHHVERGGANQNLLPVLSLNEIKLRQRHQCYNDKSFWSKLTNIAKVSFVYGTNDETPTRKIVGGTGIATALRENLVILIS
jgi:hypothetical protein